MVVGVVYKGSANIRYVYCMEIGVMRTVLLFYCCKLYQVCGTVFVLLLWVEVMY